MLYTLKFAICSYDLAICYLRARLGIGAAVGVEVELVYRVRGRASRLFQLYGLPIVCATCGLQAVAPVEAVPGEAVRQRLAVAHSPLRCR